MTTTAPIVLIEDDPDDQLILEEAFEALGNDRPLLFFSDCEKAYQYLLADVEKPFIILCDINLPRMNGIELKHRIDRNETLRKKSIPFIFLTTSDNEGTVAAAYQVTNLQGYFKKESMMERSCKS